MRILDDTEGGGLMLLSFVLMPPFELTDAPCVAVCCHAYGPIYIKMHAPSKLCYKRVQRTYLVDPLHQEM